MVRTLKSKSVYKVEDGKHTYLVTLTKLKNTYEGCPRFEAQVIYMIDNHIAKRGERSLLWQTKNIFITF